MSGRRLVSTRIQLKTIGKRLSQEENLRQPIDMSLSTPVIDLLTAVVVDVQ